MEKITEKLPIEREEDLADMQLALLKKRRSPVVFSDEPIQKEVLKKIFEAARWAPSSYNEQPWRFIIAQREQTDLYQKILDCLMPGNQKWAKYAPVLMLGFAKKEFSKNGKENLHSWHDLGLAMGNFCAQATAMNVYVHQMAGIDRDKINKTFNIPEGFDPATGIGLGYLGDIDDLEEEDLKKREGSRSGRKELNEIVFDQGWGESSF